MTADYKPESVPWTQYHDSVNYTMKLEAKLQSTQSQLDEALLAINSAINFTLPYTSCEPEQSDDITDILFVRLSTTLKKLQGKDPATGGEG